MLKKFQGFDLEDDQLKSRMTLTSGIVSELPNDDLDGRDEAAEGRTSHSNDPRVLRGDGQRLGHQAKVHDVLWP